MWKLKSLDVDATEQMSAKESQNMEREYEGFLQELESDKEMRSAINLYKKPTSKSVGAGVRGDAMEEEGSEDEDEDDIKLDELLNDLDLDTGGESNNSEVEVSVLTPEEAAKTQSKISLEEGESGDSKFDAAHYDPKDFKF